MNLGNSAKKGETRRRKVHLGQRLAWEQGERPEPAPGIRRMQ